MDKSIIFLILAAFILVITGCSNQSINNTNTGCNAPYIIVGADCCLDTNNNGICDTNEVVPNNIILIQGSNVAEKCDGGNNLECVSKKIGVDSIKIKLQSKSKDFIKVKQINLPGLDCSKDFSGSTEMRYNDAQDFEIPCKARYSTIDTEMIIVEDVKNVKVKTSGEVYEISNPIEMINKGHISGKVEII